MALRHGYRRIHRRPLIGAGSSRLPQRSGRQSGFTLLEMLLVAAILALTAVLATPGRIETESVSLRTGAREVDQALRFARQEALRLGQSVGVEIDNHDSLLRLFRLNDVGDRIYDVRNPLTRAAYEVAFGDSPYAGLTIDSWFAYHNTGDGETDTIFNWRGEPVSANGSGWLSHGGVLLSGSVSSAAVALTPLGSIKTGEPGTQYESAQDYFDSGG